MFGEDSDLNIDSRDAYRPLLPSIISVNRKRSDQKLDFRRIHDSSGNRDTREFERKLFGEGLKQLQGVKGFRLPPIQQTQNAKVPFGRYQNRETNFWSWNTQANRRPKPKVPVRQCQDKDSLEICMRNLSNRKCMFGWNCRRHHCNRIYQWQYKDALRRNGQWRNFYTETNTVIEKNYCQPEKDNYHIEFWRNEIVKIVFDEDGMYGKGRTTTIYVRRLSTGSSVNFSGPISIWSTKWIWYLKDPHSESWIKYGTDYSHGGTMTNDVIEERYQENPNSSISFENNRFEFLNFQKMYHRNVQTRTQWRIRRRPHFFTPKDLQRRNFQRRYNVPTPRNWSISPSSSEDDLYNYYNRVEIQPRTSEAKIIDDLFNETMRSTKRITKIERIENGDVWMRYKQKHKQMTIKSGGRGVNEKSLFHGTQTHLVEGICHQGFDFRFSGANVGTLYGKGSYFACEAKYSNRYAQENMDGTKHLFVAKVLVGEYTKGDDSFLRPPSKSDDNPHDLFDSCVDSETDPKIFVIFTLEQVYPEYLITYI